MTPDETIRDIEDFVQRSRENKYAFQVGLKDLDFDVNEDILKVLGGSAPFQNIDQAELALCNRGIQPTQFLEFDGTEHQVLAFDHRPVGYSGFMDCVTHSLALTDHGIFEVGRFPGVNASSQRHYWQWFLHRRLASPSEVTIWREELNLSGSQLLDQVCQALRVG